MKQHLVTAKKKGPRCPGLKKVLTIKEWQENVLPYFKDNVELKGLRDIPGYKLKSPKGKRKRTPIKELSKSHSKETMVTLHEIFLIQVGSKIYPKS